MNLIFLDIHNTSCILPLSDPRTQHMLHILKMNVQSRCFIGIPNGPRGIATLTQITHTHLTLSLEWDNNPPPSLYPIHCIIGLPRPQAARKTLSALTSLGVSSITFFQGEKAEPSYAQSSLWTTNEWQQILHSAAEQAFTTTFPTIHHFENLHSALTSPQINIHFHNTPSHLTNITSCLALDVYEATQPLSSALRKSDNASQIILAIGPERGWSADERNLLRESNFTLCDLGERVLKSETASVTAVSLALAHLKVF